MHGYRHRERASDRVSADQRNIETPGQIKKTVRECGQPIRFGGRQAQNQGTPQRLSTHRRQVTQVHRQTPVSEGLRWRTRGEMGTGAYRVGRNDQFVIPMQRRDRRIVTDSESHIRTIYALVREELFDQREFIHRITIKTCPPLYPGWR